MIRRAILPLLLLPSSLTAAPAPPQATGVRPTATGLDAAARRDVAAAFATAMRDRYVYPDVGARVAAVIEANLAAGRYDALSDPALFAERLAADAGAIAHDKHLSVRPANALRRGPAAAVRPRNEAGIARADRLAGGVGYIEVLGFPPLAFFKPAIDEAMVALKGSRALIVDVRRNGGGEPESVAYLVSFLVKPGRPINTIVTRTAATRDFTRERYAAVATPVGFADVPVTVLTGKDTFSGGEEFAYDVQALKRGTLVGEVTGGGANPTDSVDLGHGIQSGVPTGRAENPVTGTNWEGRGVRPEVEVKAADALSVALRRAGQPPVADIAAASREQVFGNRTVPRAGTEAALRRLVAAIRSDRPDLSILTPEFAAQARDQLPRARADLVPLGALRSVRFLRPDGFGGDEYALHFANGARRMALVVDAGGRIMMASSPAPLPPGD